MEFAPVKILVYAPLGVGGVTNLMIAIQQKIDRNILNFDYLVVHDRKEPKEDEVIALGSKKIVASADEIRYRPLRGFLRFFKIRNVVKENSVKILHLNSGAPMNIVIAIAAKLGGVKHVTFHSHNGGMANIGGLAKPLSLVCKPLMPLFIDSFWACSTEAAQFSFPKRIVKNHKYVFIPNGIELERFRFNESIRNEMRKSLNITDKFVIGHVGRFSFQKNHSYLIDIFYRLKRVREDAYLLLFGVGEEMETIKQKAQKLGIIDFIRFYGASDEMHKMYQAMDVFVMPSLFEGLPVTVIEAQACDLPCVLSDTITRDCAINEAIEYICLDSRIEEWVESILSFSGRTRNSDSIINKLREAGFDQKKMIENFFDFYIEVNKKLESKDSAKKR